ncbi:Protein N-acetyltransferase, RimJ/RimL family [Mucilaginibacter gossypiicola]|uniref:Protein N-acetyltransferase, RimJ/RimL family n=1 Tax=Mucilaginibacter gossypiicola TaxID=551995 RepID=A0A1H8M0B0_9SPHI|nr:GNAT family N-acetyltransferase [Mucilaginibacter gossypiicola]SEO10751.1 Protein N-acetyltransferase, RimJ/RimL family [Mucilaginibacter gossypiicola]
MLDPFYLECGDLLVHPFRPEDFEVYDEWVSAVFDLFSDNEMLLFIPEKRIANKAEAETWLKLTLLNFHSGQNYVYFITDRENSKLLGVIDILTPAKVRQFYQLQQYPHFVEFYLRKQSTGQSIMTTLLPMLIGQLRKQGINTLAAVANRNNIAAKKVLRKSGFKIREAFDHNQDLYEINAA